MNVFLGTHDIAKILTGFKEGFQSLGCNVTTLVKESHPFYKQEYNYTISRKFPNSNAIKNKHTRKIIEYADFNVQNLRIKQKLNRFIQEHDVFVFIWQSLQKDFADYRLIKAANKKIVNIFVGSEVRHISAFQQEFGGNQASWEQGFHEEDLNTKIFTLRNAELYSDLILSVPDQAGLAIRPYDHLYLPFDASKITFKISEKKPLKVIHAPSRSGIKGTELINSTIARLQSEGIALEYKLLQNIPNQQLLDELADADVLVDELYLHGPGMLGLEAMASGCAVATHTLPFHKNVFDPPVCSIGEENLYEQLRFLFKNGEYRLKLISDGHQFVKEKNSPAATAKRILDKLLTPSLQHDYTPHFFMENYQLPDGTSINNNNLELTRQVLLKYGNSKHQNTKRAIKEKLIL
jgi:glycosyltransferase involved in cell wall biosynthesis